MAQTGYGLTLSGASLGSLTGIESVTVGGVEVDFDVIKTVSDTNRIPENLPMAVREQPMELVFAWNKTIYNTLRNAAIARTEDTFTLTDVGSSTDVGAGFVAHVGGKTLNTEGHTVFNCRLQPKTSWTFTA